MIALGFSEVFSLNASRQMNRISVGRDRVPVLPASPPLAAAE
jgi:hypothetical protein